MLSCIQDSSFPLSRQVSWSSTQLQKCFCLWGSMQTHANMDVLNILHLQLNWFHKKWLVNSPKLSNILCSKFWQFSDSWKSNIQIIFIFQHTVSDLIILCTNIIYALLSLYIMTFKIYTKYKINVSEIIINRNGNGNIFFPKGWRHSFLSLCHLVYILCIFLKVIIY